MFASKALFEVPFSSGTGCNIRRLLKPNTGANRIASACTIKPWRQFRCTYQATHSTSRHFMLIWPWFDTILDGIYSESNSHFIPNQSPCIFSIIKFTLCYRVIKLVLAIPNFWIGTRRFFRKCIEYFRKHFLIHRFQLF